MEFLYQAKNFVSYTLQKTKDFPKAWTFSITNRLHDLAFKIYQYASLGNNIYPQNLHEVQKRRDCFTTAIGLCGYYSEIIDIITETKGYPSDKMFEWNEKIHHLSALLRKTKEADKKRYDEIFHCNTVKDYDENTSFGEKED